MKVKFQVKLRRLKVQLYENDTGPSNWTNWSPATTLCATNIRDRVFDFYCLTCK